MVALTEELTRIVREHHNGDGSRGLLSFQAPGNKDQNCGYPAVICIAERTSKDGQLMFIVGSSKVKIQGFKELQVVLNKSRSLRFTDEERRNMVGKVYQNRERVKELLDQNGLTEFQF